MVYLLIDYENVQPAVKTIAKWPKDGTVKILIFLGQAQAKVPDKIKQAVGKNAEFIQIDGQGKNALDFHVAFYLGQLAEKHPAANFGVISKDTGFDPLIKHLTARKISCQRFSSAANIKITTTSPPKPLSNELKTIVTNLKKRQGSLPKTIETLRSTIENDAGLPENRANAMIKQLKQQGIVKQANGKLAYKLP